MDAMNDFDRQLQAALEVEPSPGFQSGVRKRIAEKPSAAAWHWFRLALPALACAIVVVAGMNLLPRDEEAPLVESRVLLTDRSTFLLTSLRESVRPSTVFANVRQTSAMPDVIVSASEMLALQRLFSGVVVAPPAGDVPDELVIPTIAVDAITLSVIPEGERR